MAGCSRASGLDPWSAPPAATWSASMTSAASTAAAETPACGATRLCCAAWATTSGSPTSSSAAAWPCTSPRCWRLAAASAWAGCSTCSPRVPQALFIFGASGAIPVFRYDRWWTVLSAGWLHGSALHILFNMMWVRQLGPAVGNLFGPSRLVIIYTAASILGFLLSSFAAPYCRASPSLEAPASPLAHRLRSSACSGPSCATGAARAAASSEARRGAMP